MQYIGIDINQVSKFTSQLKLEGTSFKNVFTPRELSQNTNYDDHLAGIWAAKEAFIKAWSHSISPKPPLIEMTPLLFSDIEILKDEFSRPLIYLNNEIDKLCIRKDLQVSISHDGDYAIATCLLSK